MNDKSRKLSIFTIILLIIILIRIPASGEEIKIKQDNNEFVIDMMTHYVPLTTKVLLGGGQIYYASAVVLNSSTILTAFHVLKSYGVTGLYDGNFPDQIVVNPQEDLALLHFPKKIFVNANQLEISGTEIGEKLYGTSNAHGLDGVYQEYEVAKVTPGLIYISPPVEMGASGSGVFNAKGQLVGIVSSNNVADSNDIGLGIVIPATVFEKVLKELYKTSAK